MKHLNKIPKFRDILYQFPGVELAIVYGSYARLDHTPNSDLDIHVLVNEDFDHEKFRGIVERIFDDELAMIMGVDQKKKLVLYFKDQPKIEITISSEEDKLVRDVVGSEIKDIEKNILFSSETNEIGRMIQKLKSTNPIYIENDVSDYVNELIDRFVYEFENCSVAHAKSDGYRSYFFYNIALHVLVQLESIKRGARNYNFLPKGFTSKIITDLSGQKRIYELSGSLYLPDAKEKKRKLLDHFYSSIEELIDNEKFKKVHDFLEAVYVRDELWNFRDINDNVPVIRPRKVFRSAMLVTQQYTGQLETIISANKISTIIDLRAQRECIEFNYNSHVRSLVRYINIPMDPWDQPEWFQKGHQNGTNAEIAYNFFVMCCRSSIIRALIEIANAEGAVVIHCHAGKDRTGILSAIIALLLEGERIHVFQDYLASESDLKPELLEIVTDYINEEGGVMSYLEKGGMDRVDIDRLIIKLKNV